MESYVILATGWGIFYLLHSALASNIAKSSLNNSKFYRLAYNSISTIGLLMLLFYMMIIPAEWILPRNIYTKFFGLVLATYGIIVLKTTSKVYDWKAFLGFESNDNSTKKELKKEGILEFVRHPLYLGLILVFTGYFFFSPSITTLISWACTMLYLPFGIASEEKKLVKEFGDDYINYQKEVPMIIPKRSFFKRRK